ncbi:DgyrCDS4113 [Dimorphilus gyrociliatus]|uniref:DgyrCDS4113 n=1 Tax=Dimorphilus gyrociliatus TaxID=2664684 RepID=A0A7I8VI32_9ANNE|nr:DgyrCDS4113 [Dimorphilus gyrociliatus]
MWRFGEWKTVVIDDYLPTLEGSLAYTPAFDDEYWTALLEKAYAKCHKAYEAIEIGKPINALTDFTGAICEDFCLDDQQQTPNDNLFHILYVSYISRSMMVCWRKAKCNQLGGFTNADVNDCKLFYVSAVAKNGSNKEMVRLKYTSEPDAVWLGDFSLNDEANWSLVSPTFKEARKPLECLENPREFWMTWVDFLKYFAHIIVISSTEPFHSISTDSERIYSKKVDPPTDTAFEDHTSISSFKQAEEPLFIRRTHSARERNRKNGTITANSSKTIKNRIELTKAGTGGGSGGGGGSTTCQFLLRTSQLRSENQLCDCVGGLSNMSTTSSVSNVSCASECASDYSYSDVPRCRKHSNNRRIGEEINRLKTPAIHRSQSLNSFASQLSIFETNYDSFRPTGQWKQLDSFYGKWTLSCSGGPRTNMRQHSRNPRFLFAVNKRDHENFLSPSSSFTGKSHVIISLMQDYRQGSKGSLLFNIGFALYKGKTTDKEKRNLGKLPLVADCCSKHESYEIIGRFDLEPGYYLLVPYPCESGKETEFFVRILIEKEVDATKNAWYKTNL